MLSDLAGHKRTDTVGSTYMRHLESSDSERQKVEWWRPGAGGGDMGHRVPVWEGGKVLEMMVVTAA